MSFLDNIVKTYNYFKIIFNLASKILSFLIFKLTESVIRELVKGVVKKLTSDKFKEHIKSAKNIIKGLKFDVKELINPDLKELLNDIIEESFGTFFAC